MDKLNLWNRLTAKMKSNKKVEIGVYLGIGLMIALLYLSGIQPAEKPKDAQTPQAAATERGDEARLKEALSMIRGAGAVEVMLTYENGRELVPAYSTDTQSSAQNGETVSQNESTRPVTIMKSGQEEAMVLKEVEPRIRGVIVIAEGADDIKVRMDLLRAVSKALDIDLDHVEVFTMEKPEATANGKKR